MSSREQLHRVIDTLPEAEVTAALRFAEYLRDSTHGDPLTRFLLSVEEDAEDLTAEETRRLDQALEQHDKGQTTPWDQVKVKRFG